MNRFEAVVFDMDGVLVDSEPYHELAFHEVWDEMGYAENHDIHFPDFYGRSDKAVWEAFIQKHQPPQPLEKLLAWKQSRLIGILQEKEPIFDGIPELVQRLSADHKLAVASGSNHAVIRTVLGMQGLGQHFQFTVSAQDVGREKPAPDVYLKAAMQLGIAPSECCVIEDAVLGIQAGKAAGMTVVGITNSFPELELENAGADFVVKDCREIGSIVFTNQDAL